MFVAIVHRKNPELPPRELLAWNPPRVCTVYPRAEEPPTAKLTDEMQRALFAKTLRSFDDALRDIRELTSRPTCSEADLAAARDQFDAARNWLRE